MSKNPLAFIRRNEFDRIVGNFDQLTERGVTIIMDIEGLKREVHETRAVMERAAVAVINMRDAINSLTEQLKLCGVAENEVIAEAMASLDRGQKDLQEALTPSVGGSLGGTEE